MTTTQPGPVCPKCEQQMERGHIPDLGNGIVVPTAWSRGDPEERRYVGGIKWKTDDQLSIVAFRCMNCGYLEFYAPSD